MESRNNRGPDGEKNIDSFFRPLPMWTPRSRSFFHPRKGSEFLFVSPPPSSSSPVWRMFIEQWWGVGALDGYSLSMSLYFFLSMDTWSLKSTGSSLIWEWTRGMLPNQLANLFMQVWRWAKWSGSAQRDARELWRWGGEGGECRERQRLRHGNKQIMNLTLRWPFRPPELLTAARKENTNRYYKWLTCPIMASLYCFFWVTFMGGSLATDDTRKFIRMSSQFDIWSTIVFRLAGR